MEAPCPVRHAPNMLAFELADAACKADPSAPLLATHAVLACQTAVIGALRLYADASTPDGEFGEAKLAALLSLCRPLHRLIALLLSVFRLAPPRKKGEALRGGSGSAAQPEGGATTLLGSDPMFEARRGRRMWDGLLRRGFILCPPPHHHHPTPSPSRSSPPSPLVERR